MSCFPLLMQALPGNFPARNRVIAGLSRAVIVVQAAEQSGTLITATFALDQGREVGAVPGPIDDELSAGCHNLLRQGAAVIASADDIFALLKEEHIRPAKIASEKIPPQAVTIQPDDIPTINLPEPTLKVLRLCKKPQSFEELQKIAEISATELQQILCDLQFDGYITQTIQGLYQGHRPWIQPTHEATADRPQAP